MSSHNVDRVSLVFCIFFAQAYALLPPPCDSEIYCTGELLRRVQTAKLFNDDKHFVDMKLLASPDVVLEAFHNLTFGVQNQTITSSILKDFLTRFFDAPGKEFETWTPADWHEQPQFLSKIKDPKLYNWAVDLHRLWKSLGRKITMDVKDHPELYSQIYTPNPVIVPGGRFRELYYWDSYWIINGLLLSEMTDTAQGMINNFLYLVDRYGFVPNGGRIYYERRSQPPFLTVMVRDYFRVTKDINFLKKAVPALEREYNFWMQNRSIIVEVDGNKHILNHYNVQIGQPRPESYTDDLDLAEHMSEVDKERLFVELKAGAESGWDFSSRWFGGNKDSNNATLKDIYTSSFVPTDLNALMCLNEHTLAQFHHELGNDAAAQHYSKAYNNRLKAVEAVLWNSEKGVWFDYSLQTNSSNFAFYPSNLAPLWAHCFNHSDMQLRAFEYLKDSGALNYPHGVPTSLHNSGEQWDMPNAWSPLQQMLIQGLSDIPSGEPKELAFELAQKWIQTNWAAYSIYEAMFEKYDVNAGGKPGGGGEYEVQLGFGWTNGVALQLLDNYGERLTSAAADLNGFRLIWIQSLFFILALLLLL
ncbi:trehalase isoform X1 [Alosa sapidissima]|uniref:trehalase isoform X1 n=1 Tax=Alosa sapidissima TaxID=34773 RepID=UPI001C09B03E|nr:trehalase isoform X1 [Alosa sapidissima]XP_041920061.1 trehalase isoform X1 [Alosa sapidissima]